MKQIKTFNGEIINKFDLDFLNNGMRDSFVQTHNDLTTNMGGIITGLDVTISNDLSSISISPGVFYAGGTYNSKNNIGGGERGELFVQKTFTNLPETAPVYSDVPSYLCVYIKIVSSNSDSNPLNSNVVVKSINLQTGENIAVRDYPQASIIVSNPIPYSSVANINGIPLALIQVNYSGTTKLSSDGSIHNVDSSIKRNYKLARTLDVNTGYITEEAIKDGFIITNMIGNNQITGDKFLDNSISTVKLSQWDGQSSYNSLTGSGIANQNIKNGAITSSKINHNLGLNEFNIRNRVINSSFEIISGTSLLPSSWNCFYENGANITLVSSSDNLSNGSTTISKDEKSTKFGTQSIKMNGATYGSPSLASSLNISQNIQFEGDIKNLPISAFFWAKQISTTDFNISGTTGLFGKIEFFGETTGSGTSIQTNTFGVISGISTTDYSIYTTSYSIKYTGTEICKNIKLTIGGNFNGSYYIDGIYLGQTSIIPAFDVAPSEYVTLGLLDLSQMSGKVTNNQIGVDAVSSDNIQASSITSEKIASNSITLAKMGNNSVGTNSIVDGSITSSKLNSALILGVPSGCIVFTTASACPTGFTEAVGLGGRIPIISNGSDGLIGQVGYGAGIARTSSNDIDSNGKVGTVPDHTHGLNKVTDRILNSNDSNGDYVNASSTYGGGAHDIDIPLIVLRACIKD